MVFGSVSGWIIQRLLSSAAGRHDLIRPFRALRPVLLYNAAAWSRKDRWCEDVY
jgi:hypothetical protein